MFGHPNSARRGTAGDDSPAGGSSPAARSSSARTRAHGERLAYLDNLKAFLIAGIIAAHAFMGYSTWGSWTYQDIQEVTISEVTETIFVVASVALGGMFLMGLFFLLSGLMTQDSLARKGPRRFVIDRLLRLGIPFALYTLVLWPVLEWALLEPHFHRGSYWAWFTDDDPILDNGPLWFVGVLLVFSLALVAWRRFRPQVSPAGGELLRARWLVPVALAVGVATFPGPHRLARRLQPAAQLPPVGLAGVHRPLRPRGDRRPGEAGFGRCPRTSPGPPGSPPCSPSSCWGRWCSPPTPSG